MPEDRTPQDLLDDEDPSFFEDIQEEALSNPKPEEIDPVFVAIEENGSMINKETGEVLDDPDWTEEERADLTGKTDDECIDENVCGSGSNEDRSHDSWSNKPELPDSYNDEGDGIESEQIPEVTPEIQTESEPDEGSSEKPDPDKILDSLLSAANHKKVHELCQFGREYAEMNYQEDFAYMVGRIHDIVKKYRERGFVANLSSAVDDLIELSGLMVSLSEPLGFLEGVFEEADEIRKLANSAFYLEAKKLKIDGWKVTDKDAEHMGRVLSRQYISKKGQADVHARMLRNLWYGTRHMIDMLNASLMRGGSEVKYVEYAESASHRSSMKDTDAEQAQLHKEECEDLKNDFENRHGKPKELHRPEPPDDDGWDEEEFEL